MSKIGVYKNNKDKLRYGAILSHCCIVIVLLFVFGNTYAEVKFQGETNIFYTDDVAIFSASRRLSLREDPTQPFLERTGVGDDVIYEPAAKVEKILHPVWGIMKFEARAQGYLYSTHTRFNHGTYGAQVTQALPAGFNFILRYHFGPDQFVGKNVNRREISIVESDEVEEGSEHELLNRSLVSEKVTTHFGTTELEREIFESVTLRILGRYGNRAYNRTFSHRDTDFWTTGTHLEWEIIPGTELMLGYHFERGLADGRKNSLLEDDVSYRNHYVAAELNTHLTPRLLMIIGFDFEQSFYTTNNISDEKFNGNEVVYQGDVELRYKLFKTMHLRAGYQHAQRKFTFEGHAAVINTVMIGSILKF
ncbi:MAG: hypothetical protein H6937_05615 [Burkholderiales bacterium]|nr:hypothetical protein [Burkholderiales bacterium]